MNRWPGSADDSARQASDRDSRAARRYLAQIPQVTSDSDDDFRDCETSLLFSGDGADDLEESLNSSDMNATELARQKALPVEDADFENDSESWKKEIKVKFDQNDVKFFFNSVEAQMKKHGINRQWDKKDSILPLLPDKIIEECKPILRLTQDEAGDSVYKDLKTEILSLYGPREEDAFK